MERTIIVLKPDCIQRSLIGKIISRFEEKGLKVIGLKMAKLNKKTLSQLYTQHSEKPFYLPLLKYMRTSPVVCAVIEGKNVVEVVKKMCGITSGREADPGTIRGDFAMSMRMNLIHAADTVETAEREIGILFKKKELQKYKMLLTPIMYAADQGEIEKTTREVGKPRKIPEKEE